jgi:hypothetical protein
MLEAPLYTVVYIATPAVVVQNCEPPFNITKILLVENLGVIDKEKPVDTNEVLEVVITADVVV